MVISSLNDSERVIKSENEKITCHTWSEDNSLIIAGCESGNLLIYSFEED